MWYYVSPSLIIFVEFYYGLLKNPPVLFLSDDFLEERGHQVIEYMDPNSKPSMIWWGGDEWSEFYETYGDLFQEVRGGGVKLVSDLPIEQLRKELLKRCPSHHIELLIAYAHLRDAEKADA